MKSASDPAGALTMEQHAGIAVALAEGFPRAEVLAQEQIDETAYRPADAAWKKRLVADAAGEGKLFAAYQAKRAEAEDWLHRKVNPLDTDLSAWLGFLKAWSAAPKPFEILAGAGLTLADVGRLGRAWERAFARDDKLARRADKLADAARMPEKVTVEPPKLRPFPWSPGAAEAPAPPPLEIDAAPDSAPELPPDVSVNPVVPSYLIGESAPAAGGVTPSDSHLPVAGAPGKGPALPSYAKNIAPDSTAPVFFLRGTDGLPFSPGSGPLKIETAPRAPAARSGETALVLDLPKLPATPFEEPSSKGPSPEKTGSSDTDQPADAVFGTVAAFELPKNLVLPFSPTAAPSPDAAPAAKKTEPAAPPDAPKEAPSGASPGGSPPVKQPAIGETAPLDPALVKAALPFAGKPPVPALENPPKLSLLDHAALCAELALRPAKTAEILARAGLDAAAKTAIDAYFDKLRAERPADDDAWNKAYRESFARLILTSWKGPGPP